jgi:hypothetical protein
VRNQRCQYSPLFAQRIALFSRLKLGDPWATIIGCTLALGTSIYAVRTLIRLDKCENSDYHSSCLTRKFWTLAADVCGMARMNIQKVGESNF